MYTNAELMKIAIDIVKEYSRGGGEIPAVQLKNIFEALQEVNQKTK